MAFKYHDQAVRARFPALKQDQVYLDNAGGSQTLDTVIDSIRDYLSNNNVQLGASYAVGQKSTAAYNAGFEAGARYINAHVDEIVFGASTTQLFRNLSYALKFRPDDEIIVSAIDHEANIAPWVDLAERQNLVLKWWKPTPGTNPELLLRDLVVLLSAKTKLVTFTHASNILGTITDVRAIADAAHKVGALVCVDGVAYAPHRPIDVKALGVDFYSFSWYKVYGPHISMLYASWSAQTQLKPLNHFFNPSITLADKLGLAAGSYELLQSIPHIVDYLGPWNSERWDDHIGREQRLQTTLVEYLRSLPHVTIYGDVQGSALRRVATISFTVKGWKSQDVVEAVEAKTNYAFRWGAFYSNRLIRETLGLGQDGIVRVSMAHYNTSEEINGFIEALGEVIGNGQ